MIRGELTNLRAVEREDAPRIHAWFNNPDVMRWWGVPASTPSLVAVQRQIEHWLDEEGRLDRPIALFIETIEGEPLGLVVLSDDRPQARSCELSILIGEPSRWGRGFGTDALRAVLDACFHEWNLHRVSVRSEAENERAHRLYRRCGFRHEATLRDAAFLGGRYQDVLILSILEDDPFQNAEDAIADTETGAQDPRELFDIVHADGTPTGRVKERAHVHRGGDWHRAVHVWVVGTDDAVPFLLAQRRSLAKDTWPGRLDVTVGGHFRASEGLNDVLREVEEEIGVAPSQDELRPIGVRVCANEGEPGILDRELQDVFLWRNDAPLPTYRPNPHELIELIKLPLDTLLALLAGKTESLMADSMQAADQSIRQITIGVDDFIPTVDRYFYRSAIAAGFLLRGERHISV